MHAADRETFETLVDAAVAALPQPFRERIENVSFIAADWADPDDLGLTGTSGGGSLLGVYRGVPLPLRTSSYNLTMPDVIVIFQQPLQRIAHDPSTSRRSSSTRCATKSRTTSALATGGCTS